MPKLTREQRDALPDRAFAEPAQRKYPVPTPDELRNVGAPEPEYSAETHAKDALARVSANGTPREKKRVRKKAYGVLERLHRM